MSDTRLRLVFAGTPEFAVPSLKAVLDSGHELQAVYISRTGPPAVAAARRHRR